MNLSAPFIHRPVATTLLLVGVALSGAVAFNVLPVSPLPQIDFPTISVSAQLPGASPEIMASSVATPLERQLGHISNVTEMTSSSVLGTTVITLQFDLDRDINGAARDVEAAINAARTYLPSNLPANPLYRKVNPADAPIMILALTSKVYDRGPLYDAASTIMEQRLSQIKGVGQVIVGGSSLPAVRVEVNPTQLNSYGLGLPDVANVLRSQNSNGPKGQITSGPTTADITTNDQLLKAVNYQPLVIGYHNGAAVKLSDVADVEDSVQNTRSAGYMNGKPSVLVIIFRAPGANIIDTVEQIQKAMPSLKASIPAAIDVTTVLDRTTSIRASVKDVEVSLLISIFLVILVVFLFLRNIRATFIPSVAVPVSLIGTFGVMYLLHYSIDNLSLMALTISTGFVVDDAIVVIENITRHLEEGMKPLQAALKGAQEIGFTVVAMSTSLIAVFTPILLMGGIVGRLFREFAVTLSVAIVVSMLISLTATPMMCSRLLKPTKEKRKSRLYEISENFFEAILNFYKKTLVVVLRHPLLTLSVLFVTIAVNFVLFALVPKGFFPEQDNGTVFGGIQGAQDISFQALNGITQKFVDIIKADPAVDHVMAFLGGSGAVNTGFMYLELVPREKRAISASRLIDRLRPRLASIPGASVFLQAAQDLRIGGRASSAQYQYTIQSENIDDLATWGPKLLQGMKKIPGLTDVNTNQQNKGLRALLNYDRRTASRLGITPRLIDQTLYDAFGQAPVSTMYTPLNQYYVVMEVAPSFWQNPSALADVYVHSPNGSIVPLTSLVRVAPTIGPLQINHQGQFPSVTVSFNLVANMSVGEATQKIMEMERTMGIPSTIRGMFSGTLESFKESLSAEPLLILMALLVVYIVLGILYENYIHPITILSTLPSAGVGAVLALLIFHIDLSVVALIGILLLIGIVKKNAILMIDFALATERGEGKSPEEAIFQACLLRFRPILMTTMAAMFGAIPLAFFGGTGSELRHPLGVAIIGGLLVSQVLTLYTTPVVYLCLDRMRFWFKKQKVNKAAPAIAVLCLCLLGTLGCVTMGPAYVKPSVSVPQNYKEAEGGAVDWKTAKPQDSVLRGKWWEVFNDPALSDLEDQLNISNQNIAAALAGYNAALAVIKEARAQYFPTVSVGATATVQQEAYQPGAAPTQFSQYTLPVQASWAPDLFGRIRSTVKQDVASAQVSAADLENEKLVEEADLATYYFQLRNQDNLKQLLAATVSAYKKSLELTKSLYATGIDSEEAVAQAQTQLDITQSQYTNLDLARTQYEHAIALLVGKPASSFSVAANFSPLILPRIPVGVPSQLLERRPDIAASERTVAAANAQIGIAAAAYFPELSLTGSVGYQSYSSFANLFNAPNFIWSMGANLSELIFNGGLREATEEQYKAHYEQTVASYRQTVLTAFQQTEDGLSGLRVLSQQVKQQGAAVKSATKNLQIAQDRYKLGIDPYLNVITAQLTLLGAQQTALNVQMQQMTTSVQLIESLGGGWDVSRISQLTPKP